MKRPDRIRIALRRLQFAAFCFVAALVTVSLPAASAEKRSFDIPAGPALEGLKQFATQSEEQLLYSADVVASTRTASVRGEFAPRAALEQLLAGSHLQVAVDRTNGALSVVRASSAPGAGVLKPEVVSPIVSPSLPPSDTLITLAAFEVNSDRDVGYTASSALAGGRIEAPLRETPSAISIMTREFLDDIAATSFSSAAEWAPNAIPVGDTVGGAGGEHNVNLRGLGNSFPSRNYFRWYVSSDSFSTERLEFARGPNAILFGDANPGGTNTTWSKQALWVPRRSVQLRADSWGGYRASMDFNQPAGDRLAVRVNLLHDRLGGWRDYDDAQRDGGHVAVTFKFTKETQFRGEYEQGRYLRYAFAQSFVDQSSGWNRAASYNGVTAPTAAGVARINATVTNDQWVWDPSSGGVRNWRGFFQTTGTNLTLLPEGRALANFPTLPSREFSLQPPDGYIDARYKTWTFYLEHRFTAGLIVQAAFNHQEQNREGNVQTWNVQRIDVNTVRPTASGGLEPNPNFGKMFSEAQTNRIVRPNELADWRLSLAHRGSLSWIKHSLSLVSGYRSDVYSPRDWRIGRINGAVPNVVNATNVLFVRQYWDAPRNPGVPGTLSSNGGEYRWVNYTGSIEDQTLQYNQIASASSLFGGKLSVLLGYRYDFFERYFKNSTQGPDGTMIMGQAAYNNLGVDTKSAGAVWFPIPWLGAYVNYSDGFNNPGSGNPSINGQPLANSSNKGVDLGLKLELFDGRLAGSVGYYFTEQVNRPRAGDNLTDINGIWTNLGKLDRTIAGGYRDTESYKGQGLEIDLTANLTRNWRLMFNYAVPKTKQADIGAGLRAYYEANLAEWRAGAGNPAVPNAAAIAQDIRDIETTIQGYTQGRTLNATEVYTSNLYTTYSFREGLLRGFAVGGGANFRGKTVIGNVNGSPFDYLYAKSYALVSSHVSYQHRLGKLRARYQINVSNLLNERDVVFAGYAFNGGRDVPNGFRHQNPRRLMLTTNFDF